MLLFSTTLDIHEKMTVDDFIALVIEWNQGSIVKHPEVVIPDIIWNGEHNVRYGNDMIWLDIQEYRNQNITAIRYEKQLNDGVIWDTDYVMNFNTYQMTIRLERSFTEDAFADPSERSTPYFITMLIDKGYVLDDKDLPILYKPIHITNDNMELLTDIISVEKEYRLPVVYVSKTQNDTDPVNVAELAWNLKGVAHVFVQTSNLMNDNIIIQCQQTIEMDGQIGIYYPNQTRTPRRYEYWAKEGLDEKLQKVVSKTVFDYCNGQRVSDLCTWYGVNNALLQDRLSFQREQRMMLEERLGNALFELSSRTFQGTDVAEIEEMVKERATSLANEILDELVEEMSDYKKQNESLLKQVSQLQAENTSIRKKYPMGFNDPILFMGDEEQDLYPGEIKDLVISTLKRNLKNIEKRTRRHDVISDVINSND